ncbi:putative erythroid membrane-associated protein-like [Triplophysa rosa]|uniref:Erythroid membrane-associated protein-like n=1 Tax=Triplophysa rosa TaxID=992332 RepID=A0A9W7T3F6_TRIRA|nr:putative erythroid membrane-associated protein-like [Triplophysa rosa]
MSSSSDPMTERLLCCVCMDILNDPVSTPCGHNFCKTCLNLCWDNSQDCRCPNCNETFKQRPDLKINTTLRDVVDEHKKKCHEEQAEVVCDILDVTLDPHTANPYLILSDDEKQRFDTCVNVLGKEGFSSGRFYYEVQVKGKTKWDLGVVRESVDRKGEITLTPDDGFWTVILRNKNEYDALADPSVSLSLSVKPQKVGVFVDYEEGLVSFYDVDNRSHIYSYTDQSFTEKLYPYFGPCLNDEGKNSEPLIITPVVMSSSSDPMTERLLCCVCMDILNDPVSTPCGHNFCKTCLNLCWDNSQDCRCPNCNETFKQRPDLKINTTLRDVVDY